MKSSDLNFAQRIGVVIFTLSCPLLALCYWQYGGVFGLPVPALYGIAAFGGMLSMMIGAPNGLRLLGAATGIVMGLGSFGLHLYYSSFRTEMYNVESFLVGCVGAIPGYLLFVAMKKVLRA